MNTKPKLAPRSLNCSPRTKQLSPRLCRHSLPSTPNSRRTQPTSKTAETRDDDTHRAEARALCLDLGDGFLQLGLVLCSLYFLARKCLFPALGLASAALGIAIAATSIVL